jgi:hypothetical protein
MAVAMSIVCAPLGQAQGRNTMPRTFQIVEVSIEDIQAAYKSGKNSRRKSRHGNIDAIDLSADLKRARPPQNLAGGEACIRGRLRCKRHNSSTGDPLASVSTHFPRAGKQCFPTSTS